AGAPYRPRNNYPRSNDYKPIDSWSHSIQKSYGSLSRRQTLARRVAKPCARAGPVQENRGPAVSEVKLVASQADAVTLERLTRREGPRTAAKSLRADAETARPFLRKRSSGYCIA